MERSIWKLKTAGVYRAQNQRAGIPRICRGLPVKFSRGPVIHMSKRSREEEEEGTAPVRIS